MAYFNCEIEVNNQKLTLSASMTSDTMGLSNGRNFDWLPLVGDSPLFKERGIEKDIFQKEAKKCLFAKLNELSETGAGEETPFDTYQAAEHFIAPSVWEEFLAQKRARHGRQAAFAAPQ